MTLTIANFGRGVDAGEGLVHEIDLGVLVSARARNTRCWPPELADLPVGIVLHADLFEALVGDPALFLAGPPDPAELAIEPHLDDIERGRRENPSRRCPAAA
ncbi:MAG: hypothetical protein R2849_07605 [Thermomicrobiales bacterium]